MEFIQTEPFPIWSTLSPDALILYGEFDQQVPVELNQPKGERLNKRENIEFRVVPNTNHLFQTTSNGSVAEYSNIEETLSPKVLEQIKEFVLKILKRSRLNSAKGNGFSKSV
jgi:pimeloyl-ACP methyl ester carboxylesterase